MEIPKPYEIRALNPATGEREVFFFDPRTTSFLKPHEGKLFRIKPNDQLRSFYDVKEYAEKYNDNVVSFDFNNPGLKDIKQAGDVMVKLGEVCNYGCTYCSQGDKAATEKKLSKEEFDAFVEKFVEVFLQTKESCILNMYGGEPFVYFKEAKKLVAAVKAHRPNVKVQVTTNGSIMTDEMLQWCKDNLTTLFISHDGPGQKARNSTDYFDDPYHSAKLLELIYHMVETPGKIFYMSSVLTRLSNFSRVEINNYFKEKIGFVPTTGAGHLANFYGNMTDELLFKDTNEAQDFARKSFEELKTNTLFNFTTVRRKVSAFIAASFNSAAPELNVQTRCTFDSNKRIPIDTHGNVLTCGNVSAKESDHYGNSHAHGSFFDLDNVRMKAGRHPTKDAECVRCPAVYLCSGGCFYITDPDIKELDCLMAYYDYMAMFAYVFKILTGCEMEYIDVPGYPEWKKDFFGLNRESYGNQKKILYRKTIPLKVL